ncbi:MAG: GH116 family glycosyl-hydrolase [Bacteroidota bacterium]
MRTLLSIVCIFFIQLSIAQQPWPVLKQYDSAHLYNIALPLGGIGTGTVSLGGRGELRDWQIMNKPGIKYSTVTPGNDAPFFCIYVKPQNGNAIVKGLMGPLDDVEYMHAEGRPVNNYGIPRFTKATFDAAYPFGQVHLTDKELPVQVTIQGFNPFIPGDADNSGIPIAILRYKVTNTSDKTIEASVCGSIRNFIGKDGSKYYKDWKGDVIYTGAKNNRNEYKRFNGVSGIFMSSDSVEKKDAAWGTMALTTDADKGISYRTSSRNNDWNNSTLDFWDDFSSNGTLTEKNKLIDDDPMASLAVKKTIQPEETVYFNFYITWNFPNRYAWPEFNTQQSNSWIGNYYSTKYTDAWDVIQKTLPQLPSLENKTLQFVNALVGSSYPTPIKEASLFNLSVLRSQTVFRLPDGHMMGWEGVFDETGSCFGSCTHVWNYEQATPFLFGDLAKTMRDVEFNYSTMPNGEMKFRTSLPLNKPQTWWGAAADGQMGCILKMYREWQLSGDNNFLKQNWAQVKKVLGYAWRPGGWDGNRDGVMEGEQHNTMDVNYYGPNPQMQFWYLGALKAANKMAVFMHDKPFGDSCLAIYKNGSAWIDKNLFNGEYYEHRITQPKTFQFITASYDSATAIPDYQLGKGCLVDQLVGQMMAHVLDLGYLADSSHINTTLSSIMKYNYHSSFEDHFNNMRSYVLGDEAGLLMASWPKGRLKVPFPYFAESMTGFEYAAAVGMLYEGDTTDAIKCITAIRNRFDGRKRNPFDEPECGHNYARSMTSWGALLAWSGFHYSGVSNKISFTSNPGNYFWSNGYAWGTCIITAKSASLKVLNGQLIIKEMTIGNANKKFKAKTLKQDEQLEIVF